jgi:hypothetical protein
MGIELRSIKTLNQKNVKLDNVTIQFSGYYFVLIFFHKFFLLNAVTYYGSKATLLVVITCGNFLLRHLLYSIHVSKHLFIDKTGIRKILLIKSMKEEFDTFKIAISYCIIQANSSLKTLFPYNCKNIFVHFFEKANLSFRLDNKTRFSAWKMLQTTTI